MCVAPSQNLPPIGCSSVGFCAVGDDDVVPGKLAASPTAMKWAGNRRTHCAAISSMTAVMRRKSLVLSFPASKLVTRPTTIPPIDPPTAINPKSRLACAGVKTSAMNDQNIVVAKRLKTLTRMKNMGARIVRPCAAGIQRMRRKNTKRFAMAKRYAIGIKRVRDQHPDQRAGVHPRQIFNTAVGADLIADWPDDVIAAENDEVENESQQQRVDLVRLYINDLGENSLHAVAAALWAARTRRTRLRQTSAWQAATRLQFLSLPRSEDLRFALWRE